MAHECCADCFVVSPCVKLLTRFRFHTAYTYLHPSRSVWFGKALRYANKFTSRMTPLTELSYSNINEIDREVCCMYLIAFCTHSCHDVG